MLLIRRFLSQMGLKTLWEKEKSCSQKPTYSGLPLCLPICRTSLLKTLWEKEETDHNKQFLLFLYCFLHEVELSAIFIKSIIVVNKLRICHHFQIGLEISLKFVIWQRVKLDSGKWLSLCLKLGIL